MPAVMASCIGLNVGSFLVASNDVSKNSIVGNTWEMVGMCSEENCCWARAGCCITGLVKTARDSDECWYLEYSTKQVQIGPFAGGELEVSVSLLL